MLLARSWANKGPDTRMTAHTVNNTLKIMLFCVMEPGWMNVFVEANTADTMLPDTSC